MAEIVRSIDVNVIFGRSKIEDLRSIVFFFAFLTDLAIYYYLAKIRMLVIERAKLDVSN